LLLLAVIALTGRHLLRFYVEYLWFDSLGYGPRLLLEWLSRAGLAVVVGGVTFLLLYLNGLIARSAVPLHPRRAFGSPGTMSRTVELIEAISRQSVRLLLPISLLIAFIVAAEAPGHWLDFWCAWRATPAGNADPLLGKDAAFYLFNVPFLTWLVRILLIVLLTTLILTCLAYLAVAGVSLRTRQPVLLPRARGHLTVLAAPLLLILAAKYRLEAYGLLFTRGNVFWGPGYTEARVILPALNVGTALSLLAFLLALMSVRGRGGKPLLSCVVAALAVPVLGRVVAAPLVQKFVVTPNEITLQKPYIRNNIEATLRAYDLHGVTTLNFPVDNNLSVDDLARHQTALASVRLWDHRPLRDTYQQLQEIRSYYRFLDVDVDRYWLDGRYLQVALSARELDVSRLEPGAQNWVNGHLKYTHGYGVCLSPVSATTKEGLPLLLVKDIPPVSTGKLKIERPEIYFGEADLPYILTNTSEPEIDYPLGATNAQCFYQSRSGIPIGSIFRRMAFAAYLGDLKILLFRGTTRESQILLRRNIIDRVRSIAPFLSLDSNPYIVISSGRLFWVLDGYTISSRYPYSAPITREGINYIRNSVKVVVDAYTGHTTFYLHDATDPVVTTYSRIFPRLFRPLSAMPADLQQHLRYPIDLMKIQAHIYALYHMTDPDTFYAKEDPWRIADEVIESRGNVRQMEPYYVIMRLPEGGLAGGEGGDNPRPEFVLLIPFTPQHRPNMIAWMCARCDAPERGRLVVYQLGKGKNIEGPMQVESLIDQDTGISALMTLWGEMGSSVIRGNLMLLPLANSLLYIEPIYLKATATPLPQLKRVIVVFNNRVVMKPTLREALESLFSQVPPAGASAGNFDSAGRLEAPEAPAQLPELVEEALRQLNNVQENLKAGNWEKFSRSLQSLQSVLERMRSEQRRGEE